MLFLLLVILVHFAFATKWHELNDYNYDKYCKEFNKRHLQKEIFGRKLIFDQRLRIINKHNNDPSKTWKQGVNHFTDMTDAEIRSLLGRKLTSQHIIQSNQPRMQQIRRATRILPHDVDWRSQGVVSPVKNQGRCGSCWAFSAAETLESYYAIASGQLKTLSEQQILDCTPNATGCGIGVGGGCNGGTVEQAYDRIIRMKGLSTEWTYPYNSFFGENYKCNISRTEPAQDRVKIESFVVLPPNEYHPLLEHVALFGPPSISVDAGSWFAYESGVFNGCNQTNPDINHAVQLVGYGTDFKFGDYWLVKNSWGPEWGENGYIRIHRTSDIECGMDLTPENGNGCPGDPPVKVCGTCGILFDSVYPIVAE